jgi:creatinine amidohydrolase
MEVSSVLLGKHTRREFRERMQAGQLRACIIPIAAVEQHLEHLAMEHDWRSVTRVAVEVAERLRPQVLVADAVMVGISEHHMKHPGTLTLRPGTFLAVLCDLIRSVVHGGFRTVLVLNGHGGNVVPCQAAWDQLVREHQINLQFLSYWDVLTRKDARDILRSGDRLPEDLPGHAQEFETSIALAAFPENVRIDLCSAQADPTPALATAVKGQALLERIVERVAGYLQEMIDGQRVVPIPAFHP